MIMRLTKRAIFRRAHVSNHLFETRINHHLKFNRSLCSFFPPVSDVFIASFPRYRSFQSLRVNFREKMDRIDKVRLARSIRADDSRQRSRGEGHIAQRLVVANCQLTQKHRLYCELCDLYHAGHGKALPVEFDAFQLVQRISRKVAPTARWASHHRNVFNDEQAFPLAIIFGHPPNVCPRSPTDVTHDLTLLLHPHLKSAETSSPPTTARSVNSPPTPPPTTAARTDQRTRRPTASTPRASRARRCGRDRARRSGRRPSPSRCGARRSMRCGRA